METMSPNIVKSALLETVNLLKRHDIFTSFDQYKSQCCHRNKTRHILTGSSADDDNRCKRGNHPAGKVTNQLVTSFILLNPIPFRDAESTEETVCWYFHSMKLKLNYRHKVVFAIIATRKVWISSFF